MVMAAENGKVSMPPMKGSDELRVASQNVFDGGQPPPRRDEEPGKLHGRGADGKRRYAVNCYRVPACRDLAGPGLSKPPSPRPPPALSAMDREASILQ